jgi:hypothetical protein
MIGFRFHMRMFGLSPEMRLQMTSESRPLIRNLLVISFA